MNVQILLSGASHTTLSGNLTISTVTLIQHRAGPTLIDCGAWNQRAALQTQLDRLDIAPRDVKNIILTHLHWDHCMNLDMFPLATLMIGMGELERLANNHHDNATPYYLNQLLEQRERVEPIFGGYLLDGLEIVESPGHTDGHIAVTIQGRDRIVVTGDALPSRAAAQMGVPHLVNGDLEAAKESVKKLLAMADIVIPGHDGPFRPYGLSLLVEGSKS